MSRPGQTSRHRSERRHGQSGFTLIELMIAMVILGIVISAAFAVALSIMNSYREHRRAVSVERSARGAMNVLSDAVRNASPGVSDANIIDLVGCSTVGAVAVTNSSTEPDRLRVVSGYGGVVTSLRDVFDQNSATLTVTDGSQLSEGDHLLVTDFVTGAHLVRITGITEGSDDWQLDLSATPTSACSPAPAAFSYPVLTTVIRAKVAEYYVDDTGTVPVLMRDPDGTGSLPAEAIAEGVEDLQVAIGVDENGDNVISENGTGGNDDEWVYNHPGDTGPALLVTAQPYRALRLTVTARTTDEITNVAQSIRPPAEDRDAASAADVYRRRSLSTTVEIRNFSGSPL